jgi:hypothetical protein
MALHLLEWSNLATIISAPTAALALLFAGLQLRRTLAVERGRFTLEIERMLASHDRTHLRLRPGGDWFGAERGPATVEEWGQVEDYMGLFEHCEILIQSGLLDPTKYKRLFGYRIENILANPVIVREKLLKEKSGWVDFLMLVKRLHLVVPDLAIECRDRSIKR